MVQWKQIRLGTMRLWVRSLESLSGLGSGVAVSCDVVADVAWIWHCCGFGVVWQLQLRLDP